ncbi:oligoribonuclease [Corynebacterium pseudopelargi]|uniref:Oligoribonuclease n=1 Tax=Corynebacterium pseudopelargi TaxID=2080757 RepID=A0A3G6ISN4_9CORY|nr:oligoribonuclease [Corynebacterium pseudopelargi]AZA08642.1 Oligoribonuclease [Corynebacterium pseudopelargi]
MSETLSPKDNRLVWIDLEMTGLDPQRHVIVEVAALVTDADLNILGPGVDLVVHASEEELAQMDDFVTRMHNDSGLTEEIKASSISIAEAEDAVLELIAKYCPEDQPAPLAGNSIATDRSFIREHMPRLDAALHYRMVDVSSIKELAKRWAPRVYHRQPEKGMAHRALADIVESVRELDYYRRSLFRLDATSEEAAQAAEESTACYQQFL